MGMQFNISIQMKKKFRDSLKNPSKYKGILLQLNNLLKYRMLATINFKVMKILLTKNQQS